MHISNTPPIFLTFKKYCKMIETSELGTVAEQFVFMLLFTWAVCLLISTLQGAHLKLSDLLVLAGESIVCLIVRAKALWNTFKNFYIEAFICLRILQ